jgi:tetraacyldisaccharide 4'-kinase
MRAPDHWYRPAGGLARALSPLATLYGLAARLKARTVMPQRASLPVVCIGNITAGGTGKTPVAIAIAHQLATFGERPAFLTRGYGGRIRGPVLVDKDRARAIDVGDEPLLLARHFPTIVSGDKPKGADMAAHTGATVVVMDDGYQNPSLVKDAGLLVVDAGAGLGNGLLIPAGPLREPAEEALDRAAGLIVMGDGHAADGLVTDARTRGIAIIHGRVEATGDTDKWRGKRVLAYAGIGRPDKFFDTLASLGADIRETQSFADHHAYTDDEAAALLSRARDGALALVTTEKDHARLAGSGHSGALAELRSHSLTLPVAVSFDTPQALDQLLKSRLNAASTAGAYKAF